MCTFLQVGGVHCVGLLSNYHTHAHVPATAVVMCVSHSSATATAAGQSLREEQERRAEAERQVQPLKKTVSGELPTLFPVAIYLLGALY